MTKFERAWHKACKITKKRKKGDAYFIGVLAGIMTEKYLELIKEQIEAVSEYENQKRN